MQTVMTTNNGYDTILLVDSQDRVVSAWMATPETIKSYINDTDASEWEIGQFDGFVDPSGEDNEDELRTIAAYGVEVGRNGQMSDERREFHGATDKQEFFVDDAVRFTREFLATLPPSERRRSSGVFRVVDVRTDPFAAGSEGFVTVRRGQRGVIHDCSAGWLIKASNE